MNTKKYNYVIQRLEEFKLCEDAQHEIQTLEDSNIIFEIIIKEIEKEEYKQ